MREAHCVTILGQTKLIPYEDSMTIEDFKKRIFESGFQGFPSDAIISDYKMYNASIASHHPPEEIIANDRKMTTILIFNIWDRVQIKWSFDQLAYENRLAAIKEMKHAFLQGLDPRFGQKSPILQMKNNNLYDMNLLRSIFGFLQSPVKSLKEPVSKEEEQASATTSKTYQN